MSMIGANLEQMSTLAGKFKSSGTEFEAKTASIASKMQAALDEFKSEMTRLSTQANTVAQTIDEKMTKLQTAEAAVQWTGKNKETFDNATSQVKNDVSTTRSQIDAFIEQAKGVVDGALTSNVTSIQEAAKKAGTAAATTSESFSSGVTKQADAINSVMNGA